MGSVVWRRLRFVVPVAIAAAAAVWFWYPRPSDGELIAALVQRAEHGVETKNAKEITSCVSPDYKDSEGLTHTDILRLALQWARTSGQADVTIEDYQLDITRPTARGTFDVVLVLGTQGEAAKPRNIRVAVEFALERRGWRRVWLVRSVEGYDLDSIIEGI
jgi:hypothetical protein